MSTESSRNFKICRKKYLRYIHTNTFLPSLFTESFWNLAPDCLMVLVAEFVVDWIKHAFITRFNEVSSDVYKNYTIFLAYDLAQTKQKHVSK